MAAVYAARLAALGAAGAAAGHLLARAEARSTPPPPGVRQNFPGRSE